MVKRPDFSADYLKTRLRYWPEDGCFTWIKTSRTDLLGSIAGSPGHKGYTVIEIDGVSYRAARLAVLYMTGTWPDVIVDHINQDKTDDRWVNLRPADYTTNQWNRGLRKDNTTGATGVYFFKPKGTWTARVSVKGVVHSGRYHKTREAAVAERAEMVERLQKASS